MNFVSLTTNRHPAARACPTPAAPRSVCGMNLANLLRPPDLGDEDRNRSVNVLYSIIVFGTLGSVFGMVGAMVSTPGHALVAGQWYGLATALNLVYLFGLRRGWLTAVGVTYLAMCFAITAANSFLYGGFDGPYPWMFAICIVLTGVIFGGRGAALVMAGSIAAGIALGLAKPYGLVGPVDDASPFVSFALLMGSVAGLYMLGDKLLTDALAAARTARDVAERNAALVERSERALDDILKFMAEPLVFVGDDGLIHRMNPALLSLVGRDDLVGKPLTELFRGAATVGEVVIYDVDGNAIDIASSCGVIPGAVGTGGTVWVLKDVRHRKEAERRLRASAEAAEAANRSKSQFLANMSHELRTPLNAIIGYSEMLREDIDDPGAVSDLRKIEGSGKHLLSLINDVLDLSKIEAGKMELHHERFDIGMTCRDIAGAIAPLVERNRNTLVVEVPPDLGSMWSDVVRLRQVLLNLLSNAAKFTSDGQIHLSARREGTAVIFEVGDNGMGMPPEVVERLFQPFSQADASTTRKFGGTGLGLALVRHFARLLGGEVTVASEVGRGSTFRVRLPDAPQVRHDAIDAIADLPRAQGTVVLAIDDDPLVHELLARTLEPHGMRLVSASNGREGLEFARRLQPSAITLDVMMPDMDGWAVLAALKADPATKAIPVAMLTIVDGEPRGKAMGASAWLLKPIDRRRLLDVVQTMVGFAGEVLVVDDDEALRELAVRVLSERGCTVRSARDGEEALLEMRAKPPGLVLLDLMMPNMDGFQLLEVMRADPSLASIPVVVLSAMDLDASDRERLSGAKKVLAKGADPRTQIEAACAAGVRSERLSTPLPP